MESKLSHLLSLSVVACCFAVLLTGMQVTSISHGPGAVATSAAACGGSPCWSPPPQSFVFVGPTGQVTIPAGGFGSLYTVPDDKYFVLTDASMTANRPLGEMDSVGAFTEKVPTSILGDNETGWDFFPTATGILFQPGSQVGVMNPSTTGTAFAEVFAMSGYLLDL